MAKQHNNKGKTPTRGKTIKNTNQQQRKKVNIESGLNVKSSFNSTTLIFAFVVMALTFLAFSPALDNGLTNWDDDVYVTENRDIRAFTKDRPVDKVAFDNLLKKPYVSNYHPITMITFAIDHYFSDYTPKGTVSPRVFHLTNIIIHTINTGLVFWLIYLFMGGLEALKSPADRKKKSFRQEIALIGAALFGMHTIHVESVAWVAERKDVLYTMFYLLSMITYLKYLFSRKLSLIILSILLFCFALLSKAMAASMAVSLVAIDYLYKRNLLSSKVIIEKVPYFFLAIVFGYYALVYQRASGALSEDYIFGLHERLSFAAYGFTHYLIKLIVPINLSAFYAYPLREAGGSIPAFYYAYLIPAFAFIGLLYYAIKKSRLLAFGLLFFVLNIALVLQLLPVGNAIMADRYSYVPSIGLHLLTAYGIIRLINWKETLKIPVYIATFAYIAFLGYSTYERTGRVWVDSLSMWDNVIEQYKNIPAAWNNRGNALKDKAATITSNNPEMKGMNNEQLKAEKIKYFEKAISDYNNAIQLKPNHIKAFNNRGIAKKNIGVITGKTDMIVEAIKDYDNAIRLKPDYDDAYSNRGNAKRLLQKYDDAIKDYDMSIKLKPYFAQAYSNRGATKIDKQDYDGAIADLKKAIELRPYFIEAYYNVANAYYSMASRNFEQEKIANYNKDETKAKTERTKAYHHLDQSIAYYKQAIQKRPTYAEAYSNMAGAYFSKGDAKNAIASYNEAIRYNPLNFSAYMNRGGVKYNQGDYKGAIADMDACLKLNPKHPKANYIKQISTHDMAVKNAPNSAEALLNRATYRYSVGDIPNTLIDLDACLKIAPSNAKAKQLKAMCAKRGR